MPVNVQLVSHLVANGCYAKDKLLMKMSDSFIYTTQWHLGECCLMIEKGCPQASCPQRRSYVPP